MAIGYDATSRRFHLTDGSFSYVLGQEAEPDGNETVIMLYAGPGIPDEAVPLIAENSRKLVSSHTWREVAPYMLPCEGLGDYRPGMLAAFDAFGDSGVLLRYRGYRILNGKPEVLGLPATYAEKQDNVQTLIIELFDQHNGLKAEMRWTVWEDYHAVAVSCIYENTGSDVITLTRADSAALSLQGRWDTLLLHGAWACERQIERVAPTHGVLTVESQRGASGHEKNPFIALMSPDADEFKGMVFAMSLVYSGSFEIRVHLNEFGTTRAVSGIAPMRWELKPGETFSTPECVIAQSSEGLNGISHIYHKLYRERLCRGIWRDRERPVLCNNWEATYFDFDEERLMAIARQARDLGVELFVLDDGWFGKRHSDTSSLGDWHVNMEKLPGGLKAFSEKIHELGMMFGLWVEPEMVSPDSELYRMHPEWCMHIGDRHRTESRHQLVLDLTRQDVQDWLIETLKNLFAESGLDYVKWDMNRNFTEAGSEIHDQRQGAMHHCYILGLYRVLETITNEFPNVLFESCASGGGRFDPGMLYYMPQTWTSDDTDAVERLFIQYGTSVVYPAGTMGAHVSACPNHQLGRTTPIEFRGDVALGGNMGYEMDLTCLNDTDKQIIRDQIMRVKAIRGLTERGRFTRLLNPWESRFAAWSFVSHDKRELLVCVYQRYASARTDDVWVPVMDADRSLIYRDEQGNSYAGSLLNYPGISVQSALRSCGRNSQDYASAVLRLRAIDSSESKE